MLCIHINVGDGAICIGNANLILGYRVCGVGNANNDYNNNIGYVRNISVVYATQAPFSDTVASKIVRTNSDAPKVSYMFCLCTSNSDMASLKPRSLSNKS
jgi:hypothetical protein